MEFIAHPKTMRWFRDIVITEKIDGTNACVVIEDQGLSTVPAEGSIALVAIESKTDNEPYIFYSVGAQSRKRLITPGNDNAGFARWVADNATELVTALGPGRHMGEWWGSGIQRGYGLEKGEKRFSLFNTSKWYEEGAALPETFDKVPGLGVVPVIYSGPNEEHHIRKTADFLQVEGSMAAPGFMRPEGVCIYHTASNRIYKYTPYEKEDGHKG